MSRNPAGQRMAAARAWNEVVSEIRSLPGFTGFMQPLGYEQLLPVAQEGPVIIVNVSQWRCDAIVVDAGGPEVVPLPLLTLKDAHDMASRFLDALQHVEQAEGSLRAAQITAIGGGSSARQEVVRRHQELNKCRESANKAISTVQRWLWRVVAVPLISHLPRSCETGELPRVWWCPTGPLTLLPLHAAEDGTGQSLLDQFISSYTPALRALINARRPSEGFEAEKSPMLIVSTFPEEARQLVDNALAGIYSTILTGPNATVAHVTEQLVKHTVVHVHSHGEQDLQEPLQGALVLSDGRLRVCDIAALAIDAEFVGLAACNTAVGGKDVLDESITLASALHYAGFRHVVATLWPITNSDASNAFGRIYTDLTRSGYFAPQSAARAVHGAVSRLRKDTPNEPYRWASLIHVGP